MRFEIELLTTPPVLEVRAFGSGDVRAIAQLVTEIKAAPEFEPGMPILVDATGTDYLPTPREAGTFPGLYRRELDGSRMAVLTTREAQYGIGRMVQMLMGRHGPFSVFKRRDEALGWLLTGGDGHEP